jgi:hypothetical protein
MVHRLRLGDVGHGRRCVVTITGQMDVLTGAFHIVALVVLVGGTAKVASPAGFASLLRSLRLPGGTVASRLTGVAEVAVGAWAIIAGGAVTAAVIAATYAVFAVTVVAARRAGSASCGCFGSAAAPPSTVHVIVNLVSASVALAAALVGGAPGLASVLADQPLAGLPYLVAVGTGAWLAVTIDTHGSVLVDRMAAVSGLGPTFRENTSTAGHRHGAHARTAPVRTGGTAR